jgi:hypothetical protein
MLMLGTTAVCNPALSLIHTATAAMTCLSLVLGTSMGLGKPAERRASLMRAETTPLRLLGWLPLGARWAAVV